MAKRYDMRSALSPAEMMAHAGVSIEGAGTSAIRNIETGRYMSVSQAIEKLQGTFAGTSSAEMANEIIKALRVGTNPHTVITQKDFAYAGRLLSITCDVGIEDLTRHTGKVIQRMQMVTNSKMFIQEKLGSLSKRQIMPYLRDVFRSIAREIMEQMIYNDNPVPVIYYDVEKGGRTSQDHIFPDYDRTERLLDAVLEGITVNGLMVDFQVREDIAPYWYWVDRGHRVFLPDGKGGSREVGTWVVGRPFREAIVNAFNQVMRALVLGQTRGQFAGVVERLGQWVMVGDGNEGTRAIAPGSFAVKHYPKGGYGTAFFKRVGVL